MDANELKTRLRSAVDRGLAGNFTDPRNFNPSSAPEAHLKIASSVSEMATVLIEQIDDQIAAAGGSGITLGSPSSGLGLDAGELTLSLADFTDPGAMSSAHYTKLEGIEAGAINAVAGAGMTKTGSTLNIIAADATLTVNADSIQLAAAYKTKVDNTSGTNSGDVTIGTANGLSLVGQALSMALAGAATIGAMNGTADQTIGGDKRFAGNLSLGHSAAPLYQIDLGTTTANTKIALWSHATNPAGIGLQGDDVRFHGTSSTCKFSWRPSAAGSSLMELSGTGTLNVALANGITIGGVVVPTISSNSILTNKTLTSPVINTATFGTSFTSTTSNPATAGNHRLARADTIGWRNQGNSANLLLGPAADNILEFNAIDLVDVSTSQTLTNKSLTSPTITGTPVFPAASMSALGSPNANLSNAAADSAPRYTKDFFGRVFLTGRVDITGVFALAQSHQIYTSGNGLPSGFRPLARRPFTCVLYYSLDAYYRPISGYIESDGSIYFSLDGMDNTQSGDQIFLDNVSFYAGV